MRSASFAGRSDQGADMMSWLISTRLSGWRVADTRRFRLRSFHNIRILLVSPSVTIRNTMLPNIRKPQCQPEPGEHMAMLVSVTNHGMAISASSMAIGITRSNRTTVILGIVKLSAVMPTFQMTMTDLAQKGARNHYFQIIRKTFLTDTIDNRMIMKCVAIKMRQYRRCNDRRHQ